LIYIDLLYGDGRIRAGRRRGLAVPTAPGRVCIHWRPSTLAVLLGSAGWCREGRKAREILARPGGISSPAGLRVDDGTTVHRWTGATFRSEH
jgi:hypothetical protein